MKKMQERGVVNLVLNTMIMERSQGEGLKGKVKRYEKPYRKKKLWYKFIDNGILPNHKENHISPIVTT